MFGSSTALSYKPSWTIDDPKSSWGGQRSSNGGSAHRRKADDGNVQVSNPVRDSAMPYPRIIAQPSTQCFLPRRGAAMLTGPVIDVTAEAVEAKRRGGRQPDLAGLLNQFGTGFSPRGAVRQGCDPGRTLGPARQGSAPFLSDSRASARPIPAIRPTRSTPVGASWLPAA